MILPLGSLNKLPNRLTEIRRTIPEVDSTSMEGDTKGAPIRAVHDEPEGSGDQSCYERDLMHAGKWKCQVLN
ncbi:MAG: hypothetical protein AAGU11_16910 [Syntrophobacteraceae bacterium]